MDFFSAVSLLKFSYSIFVKWLYAGNFNLLTDFVVKDADKLFDRIQFTGRKLKNYISLL